MSKKMPHFAEELDRIEAIVRALESDEVDLDRALKLFEEGVERLRRARSMLAAVKSCGERRAASPR